MRLAKVERKIEYFPCISEIKETNDAKYQIGGYLNYLNNIDYGDDRTMPGAFRKTLKDAYARKTTQHLDFLFPFLWNHDYSQIPPGGVYDAEEDRKGLYIHVQFNPDVQLARELYASYKMGTMSKQSMGYKAIQTEFVKDEETKRTIRNLLEVAVMEGSAVVFPMNDLAQVDTVKHQGRRSFYMPIPITHKQEAPAIATTKDYAASYAQITRTDWCSGLFNLLYPLRNEMMMAQMGEQPEEDVKTAIKQFTAAALSYMQRGIELNIADYLQPDDDGNSPAMYMSADDNPETKAGRMISDANHKKIAYAADGIMTHVKAIRSVLNSAAQRANDLQGFDVYPTSSEKPTPEQKTEDDPTEGEEEDEAEQVNKLRGKIYDLASLLQFQNAAKGI